MAITTEQADKVLELYSAYFNRAADAKGFTFWQNSFESYSDAAPASVTTAADKEAYALQKIVSDMATSTEYKGLYPSSQSTTDFVNEIYTNLLNRVSDAEGLAFWSGHIDKETMTKEEAILKMIEGAKANTTDQGKLDAALVVNKNAVSKYFAETLKSNDITLAKGAFSSVTAEVASVATATAALDAAASLGETILLTTGVDIGDAFIGTAANETFIGTSEANNPTINLGDSLDGGAGTDTLKIISSLTSAIPSIIIKDIEGYSITNTGAGGSFAISSQSTAPAKITFLAGGNKNFTLSGLKTTTPITLESEAGQFTFAFDEVTNPADTVTLNLNTTVSTTSVDVGADVEVINLNTTGAENILASLVGTNVSELKITGDQALTITTSLASTVAIIDASAVTAKVDLSISTGGNVIVTGGTGDDSFTIAGLDINDTLDAGAGKDMLSLSADATTTDLSNVTNFETLELTAATTQDLSLLDTTGIKTIKFSDAGGDANYTKNESTFSHIMSEKTGGDFTATISSNTSTDVLNIELWNSDLGILTANDYETVNLKSAVGEGTGTVLNTVTTLANTTVISKLVITGDTDLTITDALTAQVEVDASTFTGKLIVTGSTFADTIKGGTSDDMLTGGSGVDTFTGNTGDDKFMTLTASANDIDTTLGVVTDVITDFTEGENTLGGLGTAATATNYFEEISSATDLTTLLTAADAKLDGTIQYYLDSFGGDSYLVADVNGTGYTDVIKLTGTTLADIDISNIIA